MSDFHVTQDKINALLGELRSWEPLEQRHTLHELALKFDLDVFVVDRIAKSEGYRIKSGYRPVEVDNGVDPNATTLDLDPEEIEDALGKSEPQDEEFDEIDTGVWQRKPTGEWELITKKKS